MEFIILIAFCVIVWLIIMAIVFGISGKNKLSWDGDSCFDYEIVGESHYQDVLDAICGGKCEGGHEFECIAVLVPEPHNPHDKNAIAVTINGRKVGHLSRSEAEYYNEMLRSLGVSGRAISCNAMIVGGWDRGSRGSGHYGVKLDIDEEMRLIKG